MDPIGPTATSATNASAPKAGMTPAEERKLRQTAHEVESIFMTHMLKTMRQASGMMGAALTGTGQRVYREMMDEHLGRSLAKGGGLGLADMLVRDVLRRQTAEGPDSLRTRSVGGSGGPSRAPHVTQDEKPSTPPGDRPIGGAGGLQ